MPSSREVIIFIQAYLPENLLTSEVRRSLLRHCIDTLHLSNARINLTTRLALDQSKSSPRKYMRKNPTGLRNLRSTK